MSSSVRFNIDTRKSTIEFKVPNKQSISEERLQNQITHFRAKIKELTDWLEEKSNIGAEYTKKYVERSSYEKQLKEAEENLRIHLGKI